jgi:hypothetical protein
MRDILAAGGAAFLFYPVRSPWEKFCSKFFQQNKAIFQKKQTSNGVYTKPYFWYD